MRMFGRTVGIALIYLIASAHVGSPDTWFEGNAGPYPVTVQIEPAGVVPGVAKVFVRIAGDSPDAVTIHANKYDATGGAPPPETAGAVAGDAGLYAGKLWIMSGGSNSVTVTVKGPKGSGTVVVPIVVVAFTRLKLAAPMGVGLTAMGIFLFAGLVTIVGAAVREGSLSPGDAPTAATRRRARNAMVITSVILAVMLVGGWKWWGAEDADYVEGIFKPLPAVAAVGDGSSGKTVTLAITDSAWVHRSDSAWLRSHRASSWTPLVEDHGKLMHFFAIRNDMGAFAHLHPSSVDSVKFSSPLPPLPAGHYRVFADIVHESGFSQTIVTMLDVKPGDTATPISAAMGNPDDSWFTSATASGARRATLGDGSVIDWVSSDSALVAGKSGALRFQIRNADGTPASIEPYMGMAGHAVVMRSDGSVFVHLHPMGTISMASQMTFEMREPGDTIRGKLGKRISDAEMKSMSHPISSSTVSFPYAFPKGGDYRIWVQVKRGGIVQTASFEAKVTDDAKASN